MWFSLEKQRFPLNAGYRYSVRKSNVLPWPQQIAIGHVCQKRNEMKRIVLILVSASLVLGGCVSLATSKVRRSLFVLAMLSLSCLGFAHAAAVDMPATQAEQQAVEEMSFSLQTKNMAGADAVSNPESAIPKKSTIQASANNSNSASMLGGLWTFVETMGSSIYTDTYTFTTVDACLLYTSDAA